MFFQAQIAKASLETEKILDILKHVLNSGGTTKEQIKAKFELADNKELRPLLAILQTEGLVKVGHGYYPTAKLVEAYKVTNCFNTINTIINVKKEPPTPDSQRANETEGWESFSDHGKSDNRDKNLETQNGQSFFDGGKDGANGKTSNTPISESPKHTTTDRKGANSDAFKNAKNLKTQPLQPLQSAPSRECKDCGRFHTQDCQHPLLANDGAPEQVLAHTSWATLCNGWLNRT